MKINQIIPLAVATTLTTPRFDMLLDMLPSELVDRVLANPGVSAIPHPPELHASLKELQEIVRQNLNG